MSEAIPYYTPPLGGPSPEAVRAAMKVLDEHNAAMDAQLRGTLLRCTSQVATGKGCGALHEIGSLTYRQEYEYVRPSGCSDGDFWLPSDASWQCPTCRHKNRLYASPDVTKLKRYFAEIVDVKDV